jgi:putative membrane protein
MSLILRWVLNALALLVVAAVVPGFDLANFWSALIAALLLGLANALVRPILVILTLPITVVTLGLFIFVINALMLLLVSTIVKGFTIAGFVPALLAALVLWVLGMLFDTLIEQAARH